MRFLLPVLSRYSAIVVQFLIAALVTNRLPVDGAGQYFTIAGLVLSSYFLAGLGLPDGLVRTVPPLLERGEAAAATRLVRAAFATGLMSALVLSALFGLAIWLGGAAAKIAFGAAVWWLGYGTMFVGAQGLVAAGWVKAGAFAFYSAINLALLVSLVPAVLLSSEPTILLFVTVSGAAALLSGAVIGGGLWRVTRPDAEDSIGDDATGAIWPVLQSSWPAGAAMAAGRVVQAVLIWSPVWIAGWVAGSEAAAFMGLSGRLMSAIAAVLAVVRFSIRPELARHAAAERWSEIQAVASGIAFWATALALVAIIGDLSVGRPLIVLVFGEPYGAVFLVLAISLGATLGESFGGPVDEVLKMSGAARQVLFSQTVWLVIGLGVQAGAGAVFGTLGIAAGYAATIAGLYGSLILLLWRKRGILIAPRWPIRKE